MSFERDQDEREDEEIRKAFAEKDAQIELLQARDRGAGERLQAADRD